MRWYKGVVGRLEEKKKKKNNEKDQSGLRKYSCSPFHHPPSALQGERTLETDPTVSSLSSKESEFGVHPIYLLGLNLATNQRNPKTAA